MAATKMHHGTNGRYLNPLGELRRRGLALLLFSSELGELLALADRIGVLYKGRLTTVLPAAETDEEELGLWITGAKGGERDDVA